MSKKRRNGVNRVLKFIVIETGTGDAARCTRCRGQETTEFSAVQEILDAAAQAVEQWDHSLPGPNLALRGPDLFAHPDVEHLLKGLSVLNVQRLCAATAGLGPGGVDLAAQMVDAGITHLHIALLTDTATTHDTLVGQSGSFARVIERGEAYRERCTQRGILPLLCGNVAICRHNIEFAPATVAFLASHGVRAITLDTSAAPQTAAARQWIDAALDTGMVSGTWVCENTASAGCTHAGLLGTSPVSLISEEGH